MIELPRDDSIPFQYAYRRPGPLPPYWAEPSEPQQRSIAGPLAAFGGTVAGIGALGFARIQGRRGWDWALDYWGKFENVSPGRIFRTFGYTEALTPFRDIPYFSMGPDLFAKHPNLKHMYANMLGMGMSQFEASGVFERGLEYHRAGRFTGTLRVPGGAVLSRAAIPILSNPVPGVSSSQAGFANWWARVTGTKLPATGSVLSGSTEPVLMAVSARPLKVDKVLGISLSDTAKLFLDRVRTSATWQRTYWAGQMGRLNRLLAAPAELLTGIPYVNTAFERIGSKLTVTPGTATQMLARYTGKGLAIGAGIYGIQYLSHLRRHSESRLQSMLTGAGIGAAAGGLWARSAIGAGIGALAGGIIGLAPRFDTGIIEGSASIYADLSIAKARVSEGIGATTAAQEQEALMPGITNLTTLVGFAGFGALSGAMLGYGIKVKRYFGEGAGAVTAHLAEQEARIASKGLGKFIGQGAQGGIAERLLLRGGRLGALAGLGVYGAFAGAAALATGHVPGILAAEHTTEELKDIYSGRELVPIRKNRWWPFGRSDFSGSRIDRFQPHWYPLLQSHAKEIGLYGSEEARWNQEKYQWELEHYYTRPYPMTAPWGADIPFIGPLVASTFGKLIKPPRLMHTEKWIGSGEEMLHMPAAVGEEPLAQYGGIGPDAPASPLSPKQTLGEFAYRINELRGLTGFIHGAIKERITGSQDYFDQVAQLETAGRATGLERAYWDLELGDPGATEALRRFLPHRRRQIELYNPIPNLAPSWLPGANYMTNFKRGDPFTKIPLGEVRLPGPGYAALNPEVAGLDPEQYPLWHRYKILADVAHYSDEYKQANRLVQQAARRGELSESQMAQFQKINWQVSEKKKRRRFNEYKFSSDLLERNRVTIKREIQPGFYETDAGRVKLSGVEMAEAQISQQNATIRQAKSYRRKQAVMSDFLREHVYPGAEVNVYVHRDPMNAYKQDLEGYYQPAVIEARGTNLGRELIKAGIVTPTDDAFGAYTQFGKGQRSLGALWEKVSHFDSPTEYITPFAPMSKFVHKRSAVEEYERTRVYASEAAFWQHPIRHFLRPAATMTGRAVGADRIPEEVRYRYAIEEYFDKLQWLKYRTLEHAARATGDMKAAAEMAAQQKRTLTGVDPYGSRGDIYAALPGLDRDYFDAFSQAATSEERARIMKMIPRNQHALYTAQWANRLATAVRARQEVAGITPESEAHLKKLNMLRYSGGRPISPGLIEEYEREASREQSYAEWAREKEVRDYFSEVPIPRANLVAFHPAVDLEDVKLKMVQNTGLDMHEYNLWRSRERRLVRKPYLDDPSAFITNDNKTLAMSIEHTLRNVLKMDNVNVKMMQSYGPSSVNVDINDTRRRIIDKYKQDRDFVDML